jgi:hypothetical protein
MARFAHVKSKLMHTTVANRAGGKEELIASEGTFLPPPRHHLSIPEQLALLEKKKKLKRKAYVMPS